MLTAAKLWGAARRVKRIVDDRPIAAHLYVTERCNLRCSYCTEHDNRVPVPDLRTIERWVDKLAELGVIRIGLQGGEPLLHPEIVAIVAAIKSRGLGCSLASNGLLLTPELARGLEDAGLDSIHVSIDRAAPCKVTRKSIELVRPRLECLRGSAIDLHVTSVLYGDSLADLPRIFDYADSLGASVKAHLIHTGVAGTFTIEPGERDQLSAFIDWEIEQKQLGRNIRATFRILRYQKALLDGGQRGWTCLAGYKYLFVSARGQFWLCSMRRSPGTDIMQVTPEMLRSYNRPKRCQSTCGVYCVVGESLFNQHPLHFLQDEIGSRLQGLARRSGLGRAPR